MGTTTSRPKARCLDLTRLVSRVGRGQWTGIDRVEYEYLRELDVHSIPLFSIVRMADGFFLLDPNGTRELQHRLSGKNPWRPLRPAFRLFGKSNASRIQLFLEIRALAKKRIRKGRLSRYLASILPQGTAYLNVGHSNLSAEVFQAFRTIPEAQITVMLHDTIPLDFPKFQRPDAVSDFSQKFQLTMKNSDLLLCVSQQTKKDVLHHCNGRSDTPNITVAHLGVNDLTPDTRELPAGLNLKRSYFVMLGTIEPRKNHTLMLDVWEKLTLAGDAPHLFIIGQRGWNNKNVFDRLDRHPKNVTELNNLSDGAVASLLKSSCGLVFPSHAEGFGLPAVEAAKLGVPVICSNLEVFHEVLGEYPIYADVTDLYDWETKIRKLANSDGKNDNGESRQYQVKSLPTWDEHFNVVLRLT